MPLDEKNHLHVPLSKNPQVFHLLTLQQRPNKISLSTCLRQKPTSFFHLLFAPQQISTQISPFTSLLVNIYKISYLIGPWMKIHKTSFPCVSKQKFRKSSNWTKKTWQKHVKWRKGFKKWIIILVANPLFFAT